ncbi:Methanol O-anthraniloyltransferase [Dichanthelium oligosanthes]|uniref:Methanol O-anthraniloyltransferase n=1 Tax=Dichanthelium oligosanthes TaxID=888268 RepID=A0A1E5V1Z3_9POAL|nr:Methanol O-anthraniloyltransferase [Dichanthelium oligosanthes]
MDSALASLPMAALFVFDEHPIDQPAETIRRALSRALVPYYPIAGRLNDGAHHGLRIACTGDGVAFVAASASCTLHDAGLSDPRPAISISVEDLTITYAGQRNKDSPLLLMQVTEFSCGGFAVGVTWDHVVTDGAGMAQFMQAVGEFARGFTSPSVEPVRVECTLPELPPPIITMTSSLVSSKHNDFPSSYITVPMSFINRIKDEFHRCGQGDQKAAPASCTAFDVFTAAIWKCRARATIDSAANQDAPTALAFTVNVRKQAGAKDGYYGNVFAFGLAVATLGEVAKGNILELVRLIKDAKARVPYTFTDGAAYIGNEMSGRLEGLNRYDTLYVTSWWNLGLDDVDFGSGGPACVMGNMERKVVPACILCGRKDRADGVAAMAICVKQEHAEAFHAELRRLG